MRRRIFVLLAIAAAVAAADLTSARGQQPAKPVHEQAQSVLEKTWKQKEHGKLFEYRTGKKLRKLAADPSTPDSELTVEIVKYPGIFGLPPGDQPSYPHPYLVDLASRANAIATGEISQCEAALTENEEFVFTDCDFTVREVLKGNQHAPFGANSTLTVTRQGGILKLHGRTIRAKDRLFEPFADGSQYLLFLRYVPSTGAYIAFNTGSYRLEGNTIHAMTRSHWIDMKNRRDASAFVEEVRAAAQRGQS